MLASMKTIEGRTSKANFMWAEVMGVWVPAVLKQGPTARDGVEEGNCTEFGRPAFQRATRDLQGTNGRKGARGSPVGSRRQLPLVQQGYMPQRHRSSSSTVAEEAGGAAR